MLEAPPSDEPAERRSRHNLLMLALYDVVVRIGWIFKTESVIMPAFLDRVAGAGWIRGCLLVVNRFGQSVPPLAYSGRLRAMRFKRRSLTVWTAAMAVPFLALAAVWGFVGDAPPAWMPAFFLVMYLLFSACHGLNQLSYSTLQGKLIPIRLRGRLLALSLPIGCGLAIVFALWLMGDWLRRPDGGFTAIFGFTGLLFLIASSLTLLLREPVDAVPATTAEARHLFLGAWQVLRDDGNFRRLAAVVMLSTIGTVLFPHYQALAREQLGLAGGNLMIWVVVQNASVGLFGLLVSWIVHRHGERLALRLTVIGGVLAPLTVLAITVAAGDGYLGRRAAADLYWLVFIPLGMTPLAMKTMVGYTLEIAPADDHPRYLSTLSLCLAVPFCFSPLVGRLVDLIGFEPVFVGGAALIALAGLLTFRLVEPRHAQELPLAAPLEADV